VSTKFIIKFAQIDYVEKKKKSQNCYQTHLLFDKLNRIKFAEQLKAKGVWQSGCRSG